MDKKKLIGMGIALLVLAGLALMQQQGGKSSSAQSGSETTLLEGLDLNTIDALEIKHGSNTVTLAKQESIWVVSSLFNYPANFEKLANSMRNMADLNLGAPMRAGNIDASEYGLDSAAKTITLKATGKPLATLTIGAQRAASDSAQWANEHFIQKDHSDDVYLVSDSFRAFAEKSEDWINKELLNIRSADIVSVKHDNVELKVDGSDWTLADLNSETETIKTSEANKLRMALQYFNCTTIADPAKTDEELGFVEPAVYTAQTTNKTYIVTFGSETNDQRYIRLEGDVPENVSDWTYCIPAREANNFLISRDDLIEPKETTPKPSEEPPSSDE